MLETGFPPWPDYSEEEIAASVCILKSNRVNYWTGEEGRAFEREFAEWVGVDHAVAIANGTLALEIALRGLGVGPGDEVVVTPRTFFASISCVHAVGAVPVFADVDRTSGNITPESILEVLTDRTRAVICVHLGGWPCDLDPILEIAARNDLFVVEDCAQAHGAIYKGRSVGSIGDVGCWSFCQDKIMSTAGEGGMVTTSNRQLWEKMWSLKDHGKSWDAVYNQSHPEGFRWLHDGFGTNARMTEIQSAIGRLQLRKLAEWSSIRTRNAEALQASALKFPVARVPVFPDLSEGAEVGSRHAHYKLYFYVVPEFLDDGWDRDRIVREINSEGVPCYHGPCPEVYLERVFEETDWRPDERLPVARELGDTGVMMLVHPTIEETHLEAAQAALENVLARACRE